MNIVDGHYRYMLDLEQLEFAPRSCTAPPLLASRGPTPLNVDSCMQYLLSYPDQRLSAYIYFGLSRGFHIGFNHNFRLMTCNRNHASYQQNHNIVAEHLRVKQEAGRLVEIASPLMSVHANPMGLIHIQMNGD